MADIEVMMVCNAVSVLGVGTCVLPPGAAGLCTWSTAVSRRKEGLSDTAGAARASGAATAARALAALLMPVHQYGVEENEAATLSILYLWLIVCASESPNRSWSCS